MHMRPLMVYLDLKIKAKGGRAEAHTLLTNFHKPLSGDGSGSTAFYSEYSSYSAESRSSSVLNLRDHS